MQGLERLERAHLVRRFPAGRAYLFELDRNMKIVKEGILPLLEKEGAIRAEVFARLRKTFEKDVISGFVYGSVARGEESPDSDLDVCLIVNRSKDKEELEDTSLGVFDGLRKDLGILASILIYTKDDFIRGYRKGNAYFKNMVREGERFAGSSPKEVVDD